MVNTYQDGYLALVGLIEGDDQPEHAGEAQERHKDKELPVSTAEQEVAYESDDGSYNPH